MQKELKIILIVMYTFIVFSIVFSYVQLEEIPLVNSPKQNYIPENTILNASENIRKNYLVRSPIEIDKPIGNLKQKIFEKTYENWFWHFKGARNVSVINNTDYVIKSNLTITENSTLIFLNVMIYVPNETVTIRMSPRSSLVLINSMMFFSLNSVLNIKGECQTKFIAISSSIILYEITKHSMSKLSIDVDYFLLFDTCSRGVQLNIIATNIVIIRSDVELFGVPPAIKNFFINIFDSNLKNIEIPLGFDPLVENSSFHINIKNTTISDFFQVSMRLYQTKIWIKIENCQIINVYPSIYIHCMRYLDESSFIQCEIVNSTIIGDFDVDVNGYGLLLIKNNKFINSPSDWIARGGLNIIVSNCMFCNSSIIIQSEIFSFSSVLFEKNMLINSEVILKLASWSETPSPITIAQNIFINSILKTRERYSILLVTKFRTKNYEHDERIGLYDTPTLIISNNMFKCSKNILNQYPKAKGLMELKDYVFYYIITNNTFKQESPEIKISAIFIEGIFNYDSEKPKKSSFDICGNTFVNFTIPLVIRARQKDLDNEGFYHTQIRIYLNSFFAENITLIDYGFEYDWAGYGNYWSCYSVTDKNGDGIGDEPIWFDENSVDKYPLVYPHWKYNVSYPIEYDEISPQVWNRMLNTIFSILLPLSVLALISIVIWKRKEISKWITKIFWGKQFIS